jgi:tetratricopeptide (TPR) repeat protein
VRRVPALTLAALCLGGGDVLASQADGHRRIQMLVDAGRLDEAERAARTGGPPLAMSLGQVLRSRGRLAAAESVFQTVVAGNLPGRRVAEAELAELAFARGERPGALRRAAALAAAYEREGLGWPSDDRVAVGRAYVLLGEGDAEAVRRALAAFDDAVSVDSAGLDARLRTGDLFIEKYNAPDARDAYQEVLRRAPDHPRALLGLARVQAFSGDPAALDTARRSVARNPALVGGHVLLGRFYLEAEAYDSAVVAASRALTVDSSALDGWALLGAVAWLRGDSSGFAAARGAARRHNPRPAAFYVELAEAAGRHRRYADAVRLGREAVALDSLSAAAHGVLGTNLLRTGHVATARAHLERAFARDPFSVWHKNTLDLLDELAKFRTLDRGRFRIVVPPAEADLLVLYLAPLLEEAYDTLAARYRYRPPTPIRLELYRRHADFSVRTVGLAGLGALGVSFGPALAMDAPSARERGAFNWGSTAWHELAHTFTLGRSDHRVPRWLSEGLSVLEERRARPAWGADPSIEFLVELKAGRLRPVSRLNDGFLRPSHPGEVALSYYQASLVCDMIEGERGAGAIGAMLDAYGAGLDTRAVLARVLGLTPDELDRRFDHWVRERFAGPLRAVTPGGGGGRGRGRAPEGEFVSALRAARALIERGRVDSARALLEHAQRLFPEYAGPDAPAWQLARLHRDRGDLAAAVAQLERVTGRDEMAWDANALEAELRERLGDHAGGAAALERMVWIWPYDAGTHVRLADAAERMGDHARAVRERRAVLALDPTDRLEARYQLARALARAGDRAAARREILAVLELAPGFEKAQALLLNLRDRRAP